MSCSEAYLYHIKDAPFDPAKWVRAALIAGIRFEVRQDGWLSVDVPDDAEATDVLLLMGWLEDHQQELANYLSEDLRTLH